VADRSLGVVVLTHGDGAEALPLLDALVERHAIRAEDIVAVQNPVRPQDLTPAAPHPGITVLRMTGNLGYAGGMNAGMRHWLAAGKELILLLTGEVEAREGALDRLLRAAREAPAFGVLGPAVWWRSAGRPFSYGGVRRRSGRIDQLRDTRPAVDDRGIAPCDWVEGAAMLVRREVLEQVGLLDERFFIYFEETEFCLRAARGGWRIGVVPEAEIEQEPGLGRRPGAYRYLLARNGLEYARRAAGMRGVVTGLADRTRDVGQAVRVLLSPRSTPAAREANRLVIAATGRGVMDFARGRWGPPPPSLRGAGE
jgi:GT2 family glycosyltransferase